MEEQAGGSERAQCEYSGYSGILGDSEDSDGELIAEPLLAPCEESSVLGRLGLRSHEEMTEEEVECAFGQFAMAFHCDQYTLTQRLRAEEHDRTVALENLQLELQHTRDALQVLCVRMVDGEVREMVMQMEESLQKLESSMENIITAAETLGATHQSVCGQEARMSRAVELMSLHVEHLRRRQSVENVELLQTKNLLQRARGRLLSDSADDGELKQLVGDSRQVTRRRVSVTLIPTQAQLTDLEVKFLESCRSAEEPDGQNQDGSVLKSTQRCAVCPVDGSVERSPSHIRTDSSIQPESTEEEHTASDGCPSPLQIRLRCRRRTALKSDQSSEDREESCSESSTPEWSHDPADIIQSEPFGHVAQCPLLSWLSRSRRTLMVLLVLCGTTIIVLILLLYIRAPLRRT
ncbi:inositol 1,4,5-triphosphate receptor associated 2 isoform X2 [Pygocentrus nattereri]|uniref:inositol 1,4,5-triphosphate receptor associated 2 isoform X2 n=1 Tax=Pygocentrus nattereri TaxID=42514 RepID=UPI00189100C4|nr:inositol 1,4,5-triphosphate receptor associated 2 isoform X2 [Pygocentrus nattereri]